jgi:hypothetical protein
MLMDIYVFGAGASAPYGAPTMTNFLSRAFWPWLTIPHQTVSFDKELRTVAKAVEGQYGINLATVLSGGDIRSVVLEKLNIEELLALADETDQPELRTALERVIFKTIEECLIDKHAGNDGEYKKLLNHIMGSGRGSCLISFNYDLLLDRALVDAVRPKSVRWSYGLPFRAGIENFPSYQETNNPKIYLLKLHGSLNWCQCVSCNGLRLYYFRKYDDIFRTTWPACKSCSGSQYKPVLVAPTPVKAFPEALQAAWDIAADCLRKAETLTVIGYSFPAFDRKARDLFLKNLIVPNLTSNRRPKLTPVIRDDCTRKFVRSWFLPAVDKNVGEYCSFEEYCAVLEK